MKKIIALILVLVLATSFWGCGKNNKDESNNQGEANEETVENRLSDKYQLLAEGEDKDKNHYELVGEEDDTYEGIKAKIGVIKNNKWLIELTDDSPFLVDGKTLVSLYFSKLNNEEVHGSLADDASSFYYIGNGCFFHCNAILNSNTGKHFLDKKGSIGRPIVLARGVSREAFYDGTEKMTYYLTSDENEMVNAKDGQILLYHEDKDQYKILDTNTMKVKPSHFSDKNEEFQTGSYFGYYMYPLSEGLVARIQKPTDNDFFTGSAYYVGFYDLNGNKVIDLSKYKITTNTFEYKKENISEDDELKEALIFVDGKCSFTIENYSGYKYLITIDKKGKVISDEKVEEEPTYSDDEYSY